MRRRMMMETTPAQDWDVAYDYTMGFPEENGFTLTTGYINDSPEMTENGVLYRPPFGAQQSYYEFVPTGYTVCNEAIFEIVVSILEYTSGDNGMRLAISNGSSGAQIYIRSEQVYYQADHTQTRIKDVSVNTDYIFKIIRKSDKNQVYINNDLIYESEIDSLQYNTKTRLMLQNGGIYLLKSIKFKKNS